MPNTTGLAVKVGIFVIASLIIAIGFSLRIHDRSIGRDGYAVVAYFDQALGLETGSDVSLAGVNVGRVSQLRFDPGRRAVEVVIEVVKDIELPVDSTATVERSILLGTSRVVLGYGSADRPVAPGGELAVVTRPTVEELIASVTETSNEAQTLIASFQQDQAGLFSKLEEVIAENRTDLRSTSESFARTGPKLEELADRLNEITAGLQEGEGTMGKLYADDSLYEDIKAFTEQGRAFVEQLRDSDGTLNRLINDDQLAVKAEESFDKLGAAGDEVRSILAEQRSEIDRAVAALGELGPKLDEALADLREVTRKINEGEGTLGKLVNDPGLYDDARQTFQQVGESFEAGEEQGVIRSFIGTIFGVVI